MDNGAGSYRRFLDGDDNGRRELAEDIYIRKESGKNTMSIEDWGGDAGGDINIEVEYIAGEDKKLIHRAMSRLKP